MKRRYIVGSFAVALTSLIGLGAASDASKHRAPEPRFDLLFYIDGQIYVPDQNLTGADCLRVLQSVAHDPDSFRRGAGVYTCAPHRKVNK